MKQFVLAVLCVYIACFPGCSISGKNSKKNLKGAMDTSAPFSIEQSLQQELEEKRLELVHITESVITQEQRIKYKQQEARLIDIPLPLQLVPDYRYSLAQEQDGSLYAFMSDMTHEQLLEFYRVEMEREGWKVIASAADVESVMVCRKPTRICVITISTGKKVSKKKSLGYVSQVVIQVIPVDTADSWQK